MDPIEVEKAQRIYYQGIVYWVCRELERAFGRRTSKGEGVVCGTVYSPSNQVQQLMTELADSRLAWAEEQAAKQTPVTPYLSPPAAAGPGLDAELVNQRVERFADEMKSQIGWDTIRYKGIDEQLVKMILELRAALGTGEGWRPIETADRNANLLLYFPKKNHGPSGKDVHQPMRQVGRVCDFQSRVPSHWQPLPPDPAPNEGGVK